MLKTCQIVTRGTATGLFFASLPSLQSRRTTDAWHDARHVHPDFRAPNFERHGKPDLRHVSATDAALYVRTVGVDRIVEALVHSARQRSRREIKIVVEDGQVFARAMSDVEHALYGIPPEVIPFADNGHVLADKLLSLNHWVAESYALWISRPRGTSRAKWQRAAALKFVQALPVPADMYAMRHEPTLSGEQVSLTGIRYRLNERLPEDVRDALVLARTVEDAMLEVHGATCKFTLHALSAMRWGVTLGSGHKSATFEVLACSPAAFAAASLAPR